MEKQYPGWFLTADRILVKIYRILAYIATFALLAIVLIAFLDVCGEKLAKLGLPISGIHNYSTWIAYLHVVVVFMTCGYVTLDRGHTIVDILTSRLPRVLNRITGFMGLILGAVVGVFLAYRGIVGLLADALRYNTTITTTSTFPQWPFIIIYIVGCILLAVSFIWATVRYALGYKAPSPDAEPAPEKGEEIA